MLSKNDVKTVTVIGVERITALALVGELKQDASQFFEGDIERFLDRFPIFRRYQAGVSVWNLINNPWVKAVKLPFPNSRVLSETFLSIVRTYPLIRPTEPMTYPEALLVFRVGSIQMLREDKTLRKYIDKRADGSVRISHEAIDDPEVIKEFGLDTFTNSEVEEATTAVQLSIPIEEETPNDSPSVAEEIHPAFRSFSSASTQPRESRSHFYEFNPNGTLINGVKFSARQELFRVLNDNGIRATILDDANHNLRIVDKIVTESSLTGRLDALLKEKMLALEAAIFVALRDRIVEEVQSALREILPQIILKMVASLSPPEK